MKDVAIITYFPFWREGTGASVRIMALAKYLSKYSKLKIIFAGTEISQDNQIFKNLDYELIYLERQYELSQDGYVSKLKTIFSKYSPDVCIIEFLYLSFVREYLPQGTKVFLDAHDLMSDMATTYNLFGYDIEQHLELKEELQIFRTFDKIILIQDEEYDKVSRHIGNDKVILAPHPAKFTKQKLRKKVTNIGFLGSNYLPNVDGIKWFIFHVFTLLKRQVSLNIYGKVCMHLEEFQQKDIVLHGYINSIDSVYSNTDIIINPVRCGAGLKIKNIEALGNGLPLVTTAHGAQGIKSQINKSFLVAKDAPDFVHKLESLIDNFNKRKNLGANAHRYIEENFSPEKCFSSLLDTIYSS